MICHNCGKEIDQHAMYCEFCGIKLRKVDISKSFDSSDPLSRYYDLEYELDGMIDEISSLSTKKSYINRLKVTKEEKFTQLENVRRVMYQEKQDYNDLLILSFASIKARFSGDLNEQKRKEEKEYLDALANFKFMEEDYLKLDIEISNQQKEIERLLKLQSQIPSKEKELDECLEQITTDKKTDELTEFELQYKSVQQDLYETKQIFDQFYQSNNLLHEAEQHLNKSLNKLRKAENLGGWDTFFNGGFIIDSIKHRDLDSARYEINQAQALIKKAKSLVDIVDEIFIKFEAPDIFMDMFFDNFFFDLFGNSKITRTREHVQTALTQLETMQGNVRGVLSDQEREKNKKIVEVNILRKKIREERVKLL